MTSVGDIKEEIGVFALRIRSWRSGLADGKNRRWSNSPLVAIRCVSIVGHISSCALVLALTDRIQSESNFETLFVQVQAEEHWVDH